GDAGRVPGDGARPPLHPQHLLVLRRLPGQRQYPPFAGRVNDPDRSCVRLAVTSYVRAWPAAPCTTSHAPPTSHTLHPVLSLSKDVPPTSTVLRQAQHGGGACQHGVGAPARGWKLWLSTGRSA